MLLDPLYQIFLVILKYRVKFCLKLQYIIQEYMNHKTKKWLLLFFHRFLEVYPKSIFVWEDIKNSWFWSYRNPKDLLFLKYLHSYQWDSFCPQWILHKYFWIFIQSLTFNDIRWYSFLLKSFKNKVIISTLPSWVYPRSFLNQQFFKKIALCWIKLNEFDIPIKIKICLK